MTAAVAFFAVSKTSLKLASDDAADVLAFGSSVPEAFALLFSDSVSIYDKTFIFICIPFFLPHVIAIIT